MQWPLRPLTGLDDALVELGLAVVDLADSDSPRNIEEVSAVGDVAPSRLPKWSADSSQLAIPVRTTYSDAPSTGSDAAWQVFPRTGRAREWLASSALDSELIVALLTTDGLDAKTVIQDRPQKIHSDAYEPGSGRINGGAWQCSRQQILFWNAPFLALISPTGTVTLPGRFASVLPPVRSDSGAKSVAVQADGKTVIITSAADGWRKDPLPTEPGWGLLAVNPRDGSVVYKADDEAGTFLFLSRPGTRPSKSSLCFNTYFREVCTPKRRILTRGFPDGSVRRGLLQLPIGHRPGDRHPVIVWAYPDFSPSINSPLNRANSSDSVTYPFQYLLTQGFAFFQAPFPIAGKRGEEPMRAAVDAVVPWLDVLSRQRELLPEEYGFFGHSNAGYVALALEALTHRFKAIVAWDTFPEIGYDTLHSYADDVALNCGANLVQGFRMFYESQKQPYRPQPAPPWKNPVKYIRNDPLFSLNSASSPLLLVEGEFDTDPREMEEVYSILYGKGVPVELAYYWGEDHVFASPGNIRDTWQRTERFFRRYLRMG
jgi:dipeptidyl aminopeptidase/acylaminoacyl peptidase